MTRHCHSVLTRKVSELVGGRVIVGVFLWVNTRALHRVFSSQPVEGRGENWPELFQVMWFHRDAETEVGREVLRKIPLHRRERARGTFRFAGVVSLVRVVRGVPFDIVSGARLFGCASER